MGKQLQTNFVVAGAAASPDAQAVVAAVLSNVQVDGLYTFRTEAGTDEHGRQLAGAAIFGPNQPVDVIRATAKKFPRLHVAIGVFDDDGDVDIEEIAAAIN